MPHWLRTLGWSGSIGALIVALYALAALFGPALAPYNEADLVGDVWAPPSAEHWFGLDNLGRDVFSRVLYGAQTGIGVAFLITLLSFLIGVTAGFSGAVVGGWVDMILSRVVDALMAVPTLIFALVLLSVLEPSLVVLIAIVAILDSTRVFRLARAVGGNLAVLDFVEVARLRGEGVFWVIRREILPNAVPPLLTEFGLRFCFAFLFISALSFLGLGIQPPLADWGGMVRDNAQAINFGGLIPLFPAAAIGLLTIGVNLLVDWYLTVHEQPHGDGA